MRITGNSYAYRKLKLKSKKRKRQRELIRLARVNRLQKTANRLEAQLPRSEQWFRKHWPIIEGEQFNIPFAERYIPDVYNKQYNYIIEIDGSIHNTDRQIIKDWHKDQFFKARFINVFRIKAYDLGQLKEVRQLVEDLINNINIDRA